MGNLIFWFVLLMTVLGYAGGSRGMGFLGAVLLVGLLLGGVGGMFKVIAFGLFFLTPLAILSK